jgi:hypothetical protein
MTKHFFNRTFAENLRCLFAGCLLVLSTGGMRLHAQVPMTVPKLSVQGGTIVRIPVSVGDLSGKDVTSFEFVVVCDTTVLRLSGVDQDKTLSDGMTMFANNHVRPYGPGRMKVVCASSQPLAGDGVLVYVTGVAQEQDGTTPLKLTNCVLNAGTPSTSGTDGSLSVKLPKGIKSSSPADSEMTKK